MKTKIETYRGYDIMFDTDKERFFIEMDNDKWNEKQSYASVKKFINDYIKDNIEFVPFVIITNPIRNSTIKKHTINGIRKDGVFTYMEDGKNVQLSKYNEKDYVIYEPSLHDTIMKDIGVLKSKRTEINAQIDELEKKFTGTPLSDVRSKYITE